MDLGEGHISVVGALASLTAESGHGEEECACSGDSPLIVTLSLSPYFHLFLKDSCLT